VTAELPSPELAVRHFICGWVQCCLLLKRTRRRIRAKILPPQKRGKTGGARHRLVMRGDEPQFIEDGSIEDGFFQDD
jgi:hypothetical protein